MRQHIDSIEQGCEVYERELTTLMWLRTTVGLISAVQLRRER
jgi:hypothetical protein